MAHWCQEKSPNELTDEISFSFWFAVFLFERILTSEKKMISAGVQLYQLISYFFMIIIFQYLKKYKCKTAIRLTYSALRLYHFRIKLFRRRTKKARNKIHHFPVSDAKCARSAIENSTSQAQFVDREVQ